MIKSILDEWEELNKILSERTDRFFVLDKDLLQELLIFLEPFYDCTLDLQIKFKPTLHLVRIWRDRLISHLKVSEEDHTAIKELKNVGAKYLEENWTLKSIHNLAAVLHPQVKLKPFKDEEKKEVLSHLRISYRKFEEQTTSSAAGKPQTTVKKSSVGLKRVLLDASEPVQKKKKKSIVLQLHGEGDAIDEIESYISKTIFFHEDE